MADWTENLLEDDARIGALVKGARRVAVLGIKTEEKADQAGLLRGPGSSPTTAAR